MSVDDRIETGANYESAVEFDSSRSVFPIPSGQAILEEMRTGRYDRLGYAFGIENPGGELFAYPHRPNPEQGIPSEQWSVPSETVAGVFKDKQLVRPESIEECLSRCLQEEQEIDLGDAPADAEFTVVRKEPILVLDWSMTKAELPVRTRSVYSISISMLANQAMTEFMEQTAQPTNEAAQAGEFRDIDFLFSCIAANRTRAGFDFWLEQHIAAEETGTHQPIVVPIRKRDENLHWEDIRLSHLTA